MTMIKNIIFDFAGVISTEQFGGWKRIADKFGLDSTTTKERYYNNVEEYGRGGAGSTERFWQAVCHDTDVALSNFVSLYDNWWNFNPDVVRLVESLKSKYRVLLFSDNFDASTPSMRRDSKLNELFSKMYFSNEIGHTKSETVSFRYILNDLKNDPNECLFIDDKPGPVNVARSIGIESLIYIDYGQLVSGLKELDIFGK